MCWYVEHYDHILYSTLVQSEKHPQVLSSEEPIRPDPVPGAFGILASDIAGPPFSGTHL